MCAGTWRRRTQPHLIGISICVLALSLCGTCVRWRLAPAHTAAFMSEQLHLYLGTIIIMLYTWALAPGAGAHISIK